MTLAVVLAAGAGRKLWPLAETHPKAVLSVANRPIVARLIGACRAAGIDRVVVVAGGAEAAIERVLAGEAGVEITGQHDPRGPAWTVRQVTHGRGTREDILILHGDVLLEPADIATLLEAGTRGPAVLVSLLDQRSIDPALPVEASADWITAAVDGRTLRRFLGHHREPRSLRSAGAFVLPAGELRALSGLGTRFAGVQAGSMPPEEVPVEQVFNDLVDAGRPVAAVVAKGPFVDVDKPWHLLTANDLAVRQRTGSGPERDLADGAGIDPAARVRGRVRLGRNSRIEGPVLVDGDLWAGDDVLIADGAIVRGPLVVGDRSRLTEHCHVIGPSSIGADCVLAHAAEFRGLAMEHVYLFHFMEWFGVLGSCVNLGAGTVCGTLRFDDRPQSQRVGAQRIGARREVPNDYASACTIGAYSRTGVNVTLQPGVRIGSYSAIGPGVLVTDDVPSRTLVTLKQELVRRRWGPEMHGW